MAAAKEIIEFEEFSVTVIRSRRKTLSLEIGAEGVKARAPMRMSMRSIRQFLAHKSHWIRRHMANRPKKAQPLSLVTGASLLYQGEPLSLRVLPGQRGRGLKHDDELLLPVTHSHLPLANTTKNKLLKFYKDAAQQTLEQRVNYFAELMSVPNTKCTPIKVRDYKRRWGSCDHLGKLSFNWRIIQAPESVLDYVVVHELAHCHEFNHSKRFWQIVAKQMPEWRTQQNWLQDHGASLYRF